MYSNQSGNNIQVIKLEKSNEHKSSGQPQSILGCTYTGLDTPIPDQVYLPDNEVTQVQSQNWFPSGLVRVYLSQKHILALIADAKISLENLRQSIIFNIWWKTIIHFG